MVLTFRVALSTSFKSLWECPTGTLKVGFLGMPDSVRLRVKRNLTDHYRHCQSILGYSWWQGSRTGHFPPLIGEVRSVHDHHVELFKMSMQEISSPGLVTTAPVEQLCGRKTDTGSEGEILCGEESLVHCPVFDWPFLCARENPSLCLPLYLPWVLDLAPLW